MIDSPKEQADLKGYAFNGFFLDVINKKLTYGEIIFKLDDLDFKILLHLIEKYPIPAKYEEINSKIIRHTKYRDMTHKSISRIRNHIKFVRKNYKQNAEELKHLNIETIKDKGYCLHADLEKVYVETIKNETEIKDEITPEEATKIESEIKEKIISKDNSQFQEISQDNSIRKIMLWGVLVVGIGLLFGLYYFWEKEKPLKVNKADIVLDLNTDKWRALTKVQKEGKEKLFQAVIKNNYELEKRAEVKSFDVRVGIDTQGLGPELDNFNNYPRIIGGSPEEITKEFKKCNEFDNYRWFRFDITNENIMSQFNKNYNLNVFNAHNDPNNEFHTQVIYYPTRNLTVKIIFPENKPFIPNQVVYSHKQICDKTYKPKYPTKLTNPDETLTEFVIEDSANNEITWFIKEPELYYMYEIRWNW